MSLLYMHVSALWCGTFMCCRTPSLASCDTKEAVVSGLDPSKVSSLSVEWSGTQPLLQEHPSKMATALRLFLQGLGYGAHT